MTAFARLLCIVVVAVGISAMAQPPDSLWSRTYGGNVDEECDAIVKTLDGGLLLVGFTTSFGAGSFDVWLERVDSGGNHIWSHTYGGINVEACYKAIPLEDGGFILAGHTGSYGAGDFDYWLLKIDSQGSQLWSRTYGGSSADRCFDAIRTSDGGYVMAGLTQSFGAHSSDIWILKVSDTGDSLWSRKFGGTGQDVAIAVTESGDGSLLFTGITGSQGEPNGDVILQKLSASGDSLWVHTFGGNQYDAPWAIAQTPTGGYAIAGYTNSMGAGASDFYFVVTDESGNELWHRTYGGAMDEWCYDMIPMSSDGYLLAGRTASFGSGGYDMWALRIALNGDSLWSKTFGTSAFEDCRGATVIGGNYYLAGSEDLNGDGFSDILLVKTGFDSTLDTPETVLLPTTFGLTAYPNPFNGTIQIAYTIDRIGKTELKVYNIVGQEVATLLSGYGSSLGTHNTTWSAINSKGAPLASGTYIVELNNAGQRAVHKVMLVR